VTVSSIQAIQRYFEEWLTAVVWRGVALYSWIGLDVGDTDSRSAIWESASGKASSHTVHLVHGYRSGGVHLAPLRIVFK